MTEQMLITFHGLVLWPRKIQKRADFDLWFCLFVLAKTMILVSLLNNIKIKIHIGHLNLATDFADFNIWLISNFGRFASRELHFNEKSTF